VPVYETRGLKVSFVGHPLLDIVRTEESREAMLTRVGLAAGIPTVAILPGSRREEVAYHLPVLLEAARRLSRDAAVQFLMVCASTVDRQGLESMLQGFPIKIPIVDDRRYDAVNASDLAWTASGTVTLETALLLKPMIIVYRLSWLTYALARMLVKVKHIGIVNIVAGEAIVPELIQSAFTADGVVRETRKIMENQDLRESIVRKLVALREKLGTPGAADRVATIAMSMIR